MTSYDNMCPVCMETMTSKATTQCGHQFCTSCLLQAFRQKSVCPCCRASLIPTEEGDDDDDSEYEDEDEDDESETFVEDAVPVASLETVIQALQKEGFSYAELVSLLLTERHAGGAAALNALVERVENIVEDLDVREGHKQRQKTVLAQIPIVAAVWGYREAPMKVAERAFMQELPLLDMEELLEQEKDPEDLSLLVGRCCGGNTLNETAVSVPRPRMRFGMRIGMRIGMNVSPRMLGDGELPTIYELFRRIP